jgi:hypothetical protein
MNPRMGCLLLFSLSSILLTAGQSETQESTRKALLALRSESLYLRSLSACIEARALMSFAGDNTVVLQNSVLGDLEPVQLLPSKIGSANIEYLTAKAVAERYRRLGRGFAALEIKPIVNSRDALIVNCAEYAVGIRRRKIVLGVAGGYMVNWHFDCSTGEYAKVKVERWDLRID